MYISTLPFILSLVSLPLSLADANANTAIPVADLPNLVTIGYTPLSVSTLSKLTYPRELAVLAYDASNTSYTLKSWTPPAAATSQDTQAQTPASTSPLTRIGVIPHGKTDTSSIDGFAAPSTTVSRLSVLSEADAVLRIVLDHKGGVMSAGMARDFENVLPVTAVSKAKGKAKGKSAEKGQAWPRLEVVHSAPEPRPVLLQPVVLNAEGKVPGGPDGKEAEPSLLQRYWWVLAILLLVTMVGGGGGEEGGK